MTKKPWLKWYPADWRQEPTLRMCSRAARSLWMDMLGLMHDAEPYGHLLINGKRPSNKQLAAVLGDGLKDTEKWLAELEEAGVYSKTEDGTIFSRRMIADGERSEEGKRWIERRWGDRDPNRCPTTETDADPITQKPETRSQNISDDPIFLVEFDLWYSAYPLKKGRGQALKAYKLARKKSDAGTLLSAAKRFAAERRGEDNKFTAHPATWLNGERWLDESPAAKSNITPFAIGG